MQSFNWKIGGRAGEGIAVSGFFMTRMAVKHGMNVFEYGEYPSLIRGGHTTSQVYASFDPVYCQKRAVDLMVVLNEDCIKEHLPEFTPSTVFLLDSQDSKIDLSKYPAIKPEQLFDIPFAKLSRDATGKSLASDVIGISASCAMLGLDRQILFDVLKDFFIKKGQEVVDENLKAAALGYQYVSEKQKAGQPITPKPQTSIAITGNETAGMSALSAGVRFFSAYPMTPTSNLLHFMASSQFDHPLVVKHSEDEIAAINEAIGASFAGVRSMTATAGGGFALMVESVSLAGITEVPLVVVEGQRPGPATGMPTWTNQADLLYVSFTGHGEFPRIVFTPGDGQELFDLTRLAFSIAEKYHTQVYIVGDKFLLESRFSLKTPASDYANTRESFAVDPLPADDSYNRFEITDSGYSPRSIPGQAHGLQLTNSYEHDKHGYATEDAAMTKQMVEKRLRKLNGIHTEVPAAILLGPQEAQETLVCWGSTKLVVTDVIEKLNAQQPNRLNAIHIQTMLPFKVDEFVALATKAKKLIMIEGNATHQGAEMIRLSTGITITNHINRYDGRPFYSEDVIAQLQTAEQP